MDRTRLSRFINQTLLELPLTDVTAVEPGDPVRAALALNVAPVMVPIPWWRSKASLERARYAAMRNGHAFPRVEVSQ